MSLYPNIYKVELLEAELNRQFDARKEHYANFLDGLARPPPKATEDKSALFEEFKKSEIARVLKYVNEDPTMFDTNDAREKDANGGIPWNSEDVGEIITGYQAEWFNEYEEPRNLMDGGDYYYKDICSGDLKRALEGLYYALRLYNNDEDAEKVRAFAMIFPEVRTGAAFLDLPPNTEN